jgi:hypothetical protein
VDLASITSDPDGDALVYALPYSDTTLGGSVSIEGTRVTYRPRQGVSNATDRFVYAAADARGAVSAAVVTIAIGR